MKYTVSSNENEWRIGECSSSEDVVIIEYKQHITVQRGFPNRLSRKDSLAALKGRVARDSDAWIIPGHKEWILDLGKLKTRFPELGSLQWLKGRISLEPEFETLKVNAQEEAFMATAFKKQGKTIEEMLPLETYSATLSFTVVPELANKNILISEAPVDIHRSLEHFRQDFPDPQSVAFMIMRFGTTELHANIFEALKEGLAKHGITGIRADEKQYHDDLLDNVLTYMHGCGFGVAVFERIEEETFNPNISLEIGYMMAMNKPVCILKDKTLKTLHSDLMGKIYKMFDPLNAKVTIYEAISPWLRDKELV